MQTYYADKFQLTYSIIDYYTVINKAAFEM